MSTVYLVACGKLKRPTACAAQDLYVGDLFQKARAYAERRGPWAILSAKHGLVLPTTRLEPYNQTLIGASPAVRTEWAALVARQLREAFPNLTEVVFLAGRDYRYPLDALLSAAGVACRAPMQGLGLGQQKQWLMRNPRRRSRRNPSPLSAAQMKGVTEAWISPEGDMFWVRDAVDTEYGMPDGVDSHEDWAQNNAGCSELRLERRGWMKIQSGTVQYASWMTAKQRETVEQWAAENGIQLDNPRGMRAHYDFSKGRRNVYARLLGMPRLSKAARRQLRRGARVEMEHTRSRKVARVIAAHHLVESPRYYQALAKMERRLKRRRNPAGEWWIDESGGVEFADGDAGDMGHEAVVADRLTRIFLDRINSGATHDERVGTLADHEDDIVTYLEHRGVKREDAKNDPINALYEVMADIWKKNRSRHEFKTWDQFDDAFWIAVSGPSGQRDARVYAMKYDGWKRVANDSIETWTLTRDDLKAIADGLGEIYTQDGIEDIPPDDTFNIEVRGSKKYYTGVPWSAIDSGDLSEVTRGHATNPPEINVIGKREALGYIQIAFARARDGLAKKPLVDFTHGGLRLRAWKTKNAEGWPIIVWLGQEPGSSCPANAGGVLGSAPYGWQVSVAGVTEDFQGRGIYPALLQRLLAALPPRVEIRSGTDFSEGARRAWSKLDAVEIGDQLVLRRNPPLGNTGWEFKQQAARRMLVEAIALAGANPGAVDGLLVQAFAYAKQRWEQAHNRILPIREYPALLHATTLELARMVASGELTRP